jgi:hypothetical protein
MCLVQSQWTEGGVVSCMMDRWIDGGDAVLRLHVVSWVSLCSDWSATCLILTTSLPSRYECCKQLTSVGF